MFEALRADWWTEPSDNPDRTPDWHQRIPDWQCRLAARICAAVAALSTAQSDEREPGE